MENIFLYAQVADDLSNTYFMKGLMAVIFWIGGFAAAPVIFMATMGIFRNITGMSSGLSKGLRGKMMARGNAGRERGFKAWKADKDTKRELTAQRRGAIYGAGNRLTRSGRAATRATRQQITQSHAEAVGKDAMNTFQGDGELNRLITETRSAAGMQQAIEAAKDNKDHYLHKKYYSQDANGNAILNRNQMFEDIGRAEGLRNKYGTDALRSAAFVNAISGKGYKAHEQDLIWSQAADVAGGDDHALASLVAGGRSAAMNAGYGSAGGASFGATMAYAKSNQTAADKAEFMDSVIDSSGPGSLFHPSMSEDSLREVSQHMVTRMHQSGQKINSATNPEDRAKALKDYKRRVADIANAYEQMRGISGAKGDVVAETMMGVQTGDGRTIRKTVDDMRQDSEFLNRRQELSAREKLGEGRPIPEPED